jgi:hypothetical protein
LRPGIVLGDAGLLLPVAMSQGNRTNASVISHGDTEARSRANIVVPAQAGTQFVSTNWIPAYAGMTAWVL